MKDLGKTLLKGILITASALIFLGLLFLGSVASAFVFTMFPLGASYYKCFPSGEERYLLFYYTWEDPALVGLNSEQYYLHDAQSEIDYTVNYPGAQYVLKKEENGDIFLETPQGFSSIHPINEKGEIVSKKEAWRKKGDLIYYRNAHVSAFKVYSYHFNKKEETLSYKKFHAKDPRSIKVKLRNFVYRGEKFIKREPYEDEAAALKIKEHIINQPVKKKDVLSCEKEEGFWDLMKDRFRLLFGSVSRI